MHVERIRKEVPLPYKQHEHDAAFDLFSAEEVHLEPGERARICTGIRMGIPQGHVGLISDRSGIAWKQGLTVLAGVIDSGYTGEWMIVILNTSDEEQVIAKHMRIAQVLILAIAAIELVEVEHVAATSKRAEKGFGSSGLQ